MYMYMYMNMNMYMYMYNVWMLGLIRNLKRISIAPTLTP